MQVHLVDGTYELFRAHFGAPSAKDRDGNEVGAVRGLLRSLAALLRTEQATHVGVAFDTVVESFRNRLFAGYKTGEGIEPDLLRQFPLAERAAAALGLAVFPMVEFEADDALATAASRAASEPAVTRVVVCSPDKDLMQLVQGSRVVCLDRRKELVYDEAAVLAKFGVPPPSIPDWLALVGDPQDGIPGIPRWGEKGASAVLGRYLHLEAIPDDYAAWAVKVRGAESLARELAARRPDARLYRTLAPLRTDVPIDASLPARVRRAPDPAALRHLCEELDFASFADRHLGA